jgi:UDP-glucose 4-epimerase
MRRILITGSSGYIGEQLVRTLSARPDVERIIGVDRAPSRVTLAKFAPLVQDVAVPVDAILEDNAIDTVVHAAYPVRPRHDEVREHRALLRSTGRLFESAADRGVAQFLFFSSATVYGFRDDASDRPFAEDDPLCENTRLAYARYKVQSEMLLQTAANAVGTPALTVLRPSFIVGRGSRNPLFEYLARPWMFLPRRLARLQLTHIEDVAAAVGELIARRIGGVFNLGAPGGVDARQIAERLGGRAIGLPAGLLHPLNTIAWHLRMSALTPAPTATIELLERPWQVESKRIESRLGFTFRYSSDAALDCMAREQMEARYLERFST